MHRIISTSLFFALNTLIVCAQNTSEIKTMKIWKNGAYTSFDISETDSITFSEEEENSEILTPSEIVSDYGEEMLKNAKSEVYVRFREFYEQEQTLESYALGLREGNVITPESELISSCWSKGYSVVALCNNAIQIINNRNYSSNPENYYAQFRCMRELTLYMMSQLWGDIPAPDKVITEIDNIYEASRYDILENAYLTIEGYKDRFTDDSDYYLNAQNYLPFMREIEIELEDYGHPYRYNYQTLNTRFRLWADGSAALTVIDEDSWTMLLKEKDSTTDYNAFAEELLASFGKRYGVWKAMVRIGKATPKNGMESCLLFPKPQSEIQLNPNIHQNEGYVLTR